MNALVLAQEGGFHPPSVDLFEYPAFWWSRGWELFGLSLEFNRVTMLMFLGVAIVGVVMIAAFRNASVVPGKLQAGAEALVGFIRENIVLEVMGPAGLRWVPLLVTMFLFIWMNNLFGILPGVNFSVTSRMAVPAFLALMVWTIFILVGIREQGAFSYFKNTLVPGGVPKAILILIVPIELVSVFIVRPLTLAVRLFANMMAGHLILTIFFVAANAFLFDFHDYSFNAKGSIVGLTSFAFGVGLTGFELLVGVLQAYIFTILTAVYISSSMSAEH